MLAQGKKVAFLAKDRRAQAVAAQEVKLVRGGEISHPVPGTVLSLGMRLGGKPDAPCVLGTRVLSVGGRVAGIPARGADSGVAVTGGWGRLLTSVGVWMAGGQAEATESGQGQDWLSPALEVALVAAEVEDTEGAGGVGPEGTLGTVGGAQLQLSSPRLPRCTCTSCSGAWPTSTPKACATATSSPRTCWWTPTQLSSSSVILAGGPVSPGWVWRGPLTSRLMFTPVPLCPQCKAVGSGGAQCLVHLFPLLPGPGADLWSH